MDILEAIIEAIDDDAPVGTVMRGLFWTAVVSRRCGLASTMMRETCLDEQKDDETALAYMEKTALELAREAVSNDITKASVGLASINSLIDIDPGRCVSANAADLLAKLGKDRSVAVVGHFPFIDDLRKVTKNVWVIEKWQRPGDYPEEDAKTYLPRADIVAISSTTLMNGTLSGLLSLCRKESVTMLLGPTTPMTPVLFDFGIDIISGSLVTDVPLALKSIGEGVNFRQLKRTGSVRLITMTRGAL